MGIGDKAKELAGDLADKAKDLAGKADDKAEEMGEKEGIVGKIGDAAHKVLDKLDGDK